MNQFSLNLNGKLYELSSPKVMGILNVTPDSFYAILSKGNGDIKRYS